MALTLYGSTPTFEATLSANQTISNTTFTKVAFNTENIDTNSNYDTTTYRFTPTVAGYYLVNATALVYTSVAASVMIGSLYKNGSEYRRADNRASSTYLQQMACTVSDIVYMNGSTDYLEMYAYINASGGTLQVLGPSSTFNYSQFSATLIRSTA